MRSITKSDTPWSRPPCARLAFSKCPISTILASSTCSKRGGPLAPAQKSHASVDRANHGSVTRATSQTKRQVAFIVSPLISLHRTLTAQSITQLLRRDRLQVQHFLGVVHPVPV